MTYNDCHIIIKTMSDYIPNPANYTMKGNTPPHKDAPARVDIRTDMNANEWNAMSDAKLQELLQTSSGALLLACVRESKDRLQGRPVQRTDARVLTKSEGEIIIKLVD